MAARLAAKKKVVKKPPVKSEGGSSPAPRLTNDVTKSVVDEIPPLRTSTSRKYRYARVMREIRDKVGPGRPVLIAEFVGKSGASTVRRQLLNGLKPVDGAVTDWELDARRFDTGGSALYCTLKK